MGFDVFDDESMVSDVDEESNSVAPKVASKRLFKDKVNIVSNSGDSRIFL